MNADVIAIQRINAQVRYSQLFNKRMRLQVQEMQLMNDADERKLNYLYKKHQEVSAQMKSLEGTI